jgi:hypothetical protein
MGLFKGRVSDGRHFPLCESRPTSYGKLRKTIREETTGRRASHSARVSLLYLLFEPAIVMIWVA